MEFEWDDHKAAINRAKHKVAFEEAIEAFRDVYAYLIVDRSMNYDEERFITIAMAKGTIYHIAYAERDDRIRLISARRASKAEQRVYDREREK